MVRKKVLELRNLLSGEEVEEYSSRIINTLISTEEYKASSFIMCYMDYRNEVAASKLVEISISMGKRAAVPLVENTDGTGKEISACEVGNITSEMAKGAYGILEPKKDTARRVSPELIDLVVVPGVAFDSKRNRIGHGAGYYDRFLKKLRSDCTKVGVAFEIQLAESLPSEVHDVKMDMIITERRIIL